MSWLHRMGNKAVSAMSRLGKKVTGGVRRIGKRVRHSLGDIAATTGSISAGLGAAGLASALTGIGAQSEARWRWGRSQRAGRRH